MNIHDSTARYEQWLGEQLTLVPHDLELKHQAMAQSPFGFLRATFYRFVQLWKEHAGDASRAPRVLAVGDLHVANYGTWRDAEGRLIWGINDFDEAYPLPYTIDLARLAVSAHLAKDEDHLGIAVADACDAILGGYKEGLAAGGRPFVLAEEHKWLRDTVTSDLRDPVDFWRKMNGLADCVATLPKSARRGLEKLLPDGAEVERVALRVAGLGSLGRERYVMLAKLYGSPIAREAKALCASAARWAGSKNGADEPMYAEVLAKAVRALDPYVRIRQGWIIRRLAPYCSRVDLALLPKQRDETKLLRSMGYELANVHLGTPRAARPIAVDLKGRPRRWLHQLADALKSATLEDFEEWKSGKL